MLQAATELLAERGWAATGMRDIANAAGVAVETIYSSVGSKADVLIAALDVAVVGDAHPVALADRPEFAALGRGTPAERAAAGARMLVEIQRRTERLHLALRDAAASDASLAARLRADELRRRHSVEQAAALIVGRPVSDQERDGLWAVLGSEVYRLLTDIAGWTPDQYEAWIAEAVPRLVNAGGAPRAAATTGRGS